MHPIKQTKKVVEAKGLQATLATFALIMAVSFSQSSMLEERLHEAAANAAFVIDVDMHRAEQLGTYVMNLKWDVPQMDFPIKTYELLYMHGARTQGYFEAQANQIHGEMKRCTYNQGAIVHDHNEACGADGYLAASGEKGELEFYNTLLGYTYGLRIIDETGHVFISNVVTPTQADLLHVESEESNTEDKDSDNNEAIELPESDTSESETDTDDVTSEDDEYTHVVTIKEPTFVDVPSQSWFTPAVERLKQLKLLDTDVQEFRPASPINRAEAAKLIVAAKHLELKELKIQIFCDVSNDDWFAPYVSSLFLEGWTEGYVSDSCDADRVFEPARLITRAEAMKMLTLAFELTDDSVALSFTDVSDNDWYAPYVKRAYAAQVVKGYDDGRFGPNEHINRAEFATLLYGLLPQSEE